MSEDCNQNCSSCSDDCTDRKERKTGFSEKLHKMSRVNKVIGIISGKGGVGKSLVTSMLAVAMNRLGCHTAILDADVTGPSIPKIFGIKDKAKGSKDGILPVKTKTGIDLMSVNLLLEYDTDPVVWRGPIIAGTVKQFWTDVIWDDVDFMFIDMPPGTGDVPLTVFQSIAIIGLVENMSYFTCPDNGKDYQIFGESHIDEIADKHNLKVLAKLPINPKIAEACDKGMIEVLDGNWLEPVAKILKKMEES
jgi:Mrp family chromosome partitioning ATPase